MPKTRPNTLFVLEQEILNFLRKHPDGIEKSYIYHKFVGGPLDYEENRPKVWRVNAALIELLKNNEISIQRYRNLDYYYPRTKV